LCTSEYQRRWQYLSGSKYVPRRYLFEPGIHCDRQEKRAVRSMVSQSCSAWDQPKILLFEDLVEQARVARIHQGPAAFGPRVAHRPHRDAPRPRRIQPDPAIAFWARFDYGRDPSLRKISPASSSRARPRFGFGPTVPTEPHSYNTRASANG
jgi:hypothetical protein